MEQLRGTSPVRKFNAVVYLCAFILAGFFFSVGLVQAEEFSCTGNAAVCSVYSFDTCPSDGIPDCSRTIGICSGIFSTSDTETYCSSIGDELGCKAAYPTCSWSGSCSWADQGQILDRDCSTFNFDTCEAIYLGGYEGWTSCSYVAEEACFPDEVDPSCDTGTSTTTCENMAGCLWTTTTENMTDAIILAGSNQISFWVIFGNALVVMLLVAIISLIIFK